MRFGIAILRAVIGGLFIGHGLQKLTGLATPFAAAALTGTMTVAVKKVHLSKGVWAAEGGYEYNAVLIAALFAITADGPGSPSLDRREWGTGWAIAELAAGLAGAAAMLKFADQGAEPVETPVAKASNWAVREPEPAQA